MQLLFRDHIDVMLVSYFMPITRKALQYHMGNQYPEIEEGQIIQWPNENGQSF
jgi:hypothetical protein